MKCEVMVRKKITSVCPMDILVGREQSQGKKMTVG